MIHTLHLRNFKGIEAADLRFERFTVLVGPNASGKTSVLQALDLLSTFSDPKTDRKRSIEAHGDIAALSRTDECVVEIEAEGMWSQKQVQLHLGWKTPMPRVLGTLRQFPMVNVHWDGRDFEIPEVARTPMELLAKLDPPKSKALLSFIEEWRASILLRLESRHLAEPSYTNEVEPRLHTNGTGLASALAQMALNRPEDFAELLVALKTVIPQVVRVRLSLAEVTRLETETLRIDEEPISRQVTRNYSGHRILFDTKSGTGIPGEAASEGTLLVLGLLTVLMSKPRPRLVLLDDLDRGLHPKAQRDLVTQLRKLLERDPDLQIIATSHSPYLVDHLQPEEVRLSTVSPEGTIRFAALKEHPDFERWKEEMRPGEFWSTVGESWVAGRNGEPV